VLPAVRTSLYHFIASRLRDCMMLMLASGSTNYLQKVSKIPQFSTKNAKILRITTKNMCFVAG
jgi:hypothetical protein